MGNEYIRCNCCFGSKPREGVCPRCGCDETTQNAAHQLQIGTVLQEQYQIGRVLGQGGFGITYHGWDLYLDIPVAIKEYYPGGMVMRESSATMAVSDISGDDGARFRHNRERFMKEAKMLARFSQVPQVVQVKNFFKANNTAYIVMEYVEGITLKEHVKRSGGSLTPQETFALFGPIIQTMAKVHMTGIIHRDISPDNIMMVPGGAKLLDFGAVRYVADAAVDRELTKSTEAILKQGYAPIEQYQKKGTLGPWTDVYALCATIYYCLTGEVPPDSPARVLEYEVLDFDCLKGLTSVQKAALKHGMELRTERRTGSMEQLYQEMFAVEPDPTPVFEPDPTPESEPTPAFEPDPIPESEPIPIFEPDPLLESETIPEAEPIPEPEPVPKSVTEVKGRTEVKAQTEIREATEVKPQTEIRGSTEVKPQTQIRNRTEAKSREELRRQTQLKARTQVKAPAEVEPTPDKKPESKPESTTSGWSGGKIALLLIACFAVVALFGAVVFGLGNDEKPEAAPSEVQIKGNEVSGNCGIGTRWKLDRETGVFTLTGTTMGEFYLDEYDEEMRKNKLARPWEEYTEEITEVIFDDNFYRIGTGAFAHCPNLKKVTFGSKLQEIGSDAFWDTGLTEVHFPKNLRIIEWSAFEHTQLNNVTLPESLLDLGPNAFGYCPNLSWVTIPGNTRLCFDDIWRDQSTFSREDGTVAGITLSGPSGGMLEDYAALMGIEYVSDGNQVVFEDQGDFSAYPGNADGHWYFDRHTGYLKIEGEMPTDMAGPWEWDHEERKTHRERVPGLPWAGHREFISTVYVAEGVTRICDNAFANLYNLTDIYLPSTLKTIGFQAFLDTNVDEMYVPENVTNIESFAFNYSRNLRMIKLPDNLERLNCSTITVSPLLEKVYVSNLTEFECREEDGQVITPFNNYIPEDSAASEENSMPPHAVLVSPQGEQDGVKCNAKKFAEENGLGYEEGLFTWDNLQQVGDVAFGKSNVSWGIQDGILIITGSGETPVYRAAKDGKNNKGVPTFTGEAPWYPYRNEIHTVIVEKGITVLNQGALCNMPNLGNVRLKMVDVLETGAIDNCGMEYLELGDTVSTIKKGAISYCDNLKTLKIHNGSKGIADGAIRGCYALQDLYLIDGHQKLNVHGDLFGGDTLENLTIWGDRGSDAEQYARFQGYNLQILGW